jgi:rare lipoprotein A
MSLNWVSTVLCCAMGLCVPAWAQDDPHLPAVPTAPGLQAQPGAWQQGRATWYGGQRWHGRRTASGERFDRHALTAAHPRLPLGTTVRVVNLANDREVLVRINDRGPRGRRYIIDLSEAAAEQLDFKRRGWTTVQLHLDAPELPH